MKKLTIFYSALLLLALVNPVYAQQIPKDPMLRTGKLPNGQTYYIRHNETPKGRADFYLAQKVGSVLEKENQRGLAHFLEHMAFNGSKHFPGNSMITELEKKGIRFGSNLNASTSYDETIYKMMNIPVSREGIIDTSLLVLHDWAGFLTLDGKEIDEERGVIREEWRLSSSGYLRVIQRDIFPVIYAGTPYANRIPIGDIDIVNNFKHQELRDYYKKWYRPDLQGIIVVGDINVDQVEAKIKKMFADIKAPVNPAPRTYAKIPDNVNPVIVYGKDKEVTGTAMVTYWKLPEVPAKQKSTMNWYKRNMADQFISALLTNRYTDIREQANAQFGSAFAYLTTFDIVSSKPAWNLMINPKEKKDLLTAMEGAFKEVERMHRYGFTNEELELVKKGAYSSLEENYKERIHKSNREFISDYVKLFLNAEPAPDAEWQYRTNKELIMDLSLDTINHYAKLAMGNRNLVIYAVAPEEDAGFLPAKSEIIRVWNGVRKGKLDPYVKRAAVADLPVPATPAGKIIKSEDKPFGFVQWTLSNGLKVWFKQTDYKEDKVVVRAYSPGGYSLVNDQDLPSAKVTGLTSYGGFGEYSMNDLTKAITGKDVFLNAVVGEFQESLDGASSVKDRETLFKLINLKMTSPRKDIAYFETWKKAEKETFKNRSAEPALIFNDSVDAVMTNHHPRAKTIANDSAFIDKIDYSKVLDIYKKRFADASDFTFFIAGTLPADSIKGLVETYLGSLPSTQNKEQVIDHGIYPPTGTVQKHFKQAMVTPKSSIYVGYTGFGIENTLQNQVLFNYLGRLLTIEYNRTMREEEGGVYYVSANGSVQPQPKAHFNFEIRFSTGPNAIKKQKLMNIMYAQIDKIATDGPDPVTLDKAKGNLLKTMKEFMNDQNSNYWSFNASQLYINGINMPGEYETVIESVDAGMVRDFAKKVFGQGNKIEVVMDPSGI